jgi:iron complex transport system substrate-binding protein
MLAWSFFGVTIPARSAADQPTPCRQLVSLSPHLTEILFAIGAGAQLVGVTDYCTYPAATKDLPKFGSLLALRTEQILARNPCAVVYSAAQPGDINRLRAGQVPLLFLPTETVADITSAILELGQVTGQIQKAQALKISIEEDLTSLSQQIQAHQTPGPPRVLLVLSRRPGSIVRDVLTAGPRTYFDDLIRVAGGVNVAHGSPTRYPTFSSEALLTSDQPTVILELLESEGAHRRGRTLAEAQTDAEKAWSTFYGTSPLRPRILVLSAPGLMIPGPRVAQSARILGWAIHPYLFANANPQP